MSAYRLSFADSTSHTPKHPDRTAKRNETGGLNFDVVYQVWPNRTAMLRVIAKQTQRAPKVSDWRACT